MSALWGKNPGLEDIFQCRQAKMTLNVDEKAYYDISSTADRILDACYYRDAQRFVIFSRVLMSGRALLLGVCSFVAFKGDTGNFKFLMVPEEIDHRHTFQALMNVMAVDKVVVPEIALRAWLQQDPFFRKFSSLFTPPEQTPATLIWNIPLIRLP